MKNQHQPPQNPSFPPPVGITWLNLVNFRNNEQTEYTIYAPIVIVLGPNGIGKTNILEALSLLAPGRGLRSSKLSQISNIHLQKPWLMTTRLETGSGPITIGTGLEFSPTGTEKRILRINQTPVRNQSHLNEWVSVVWAIPAMARLFEESSSARRKFIDRMAVIIDPTHNERINRYEHFLRERSLLLRNSLRDGGFSESWVQTLEQRLAADGLAITHTRAQLVRQLTQLQPKNPKSPFPRFFAEMRGDIERWCRDLSALEAEEKLLTHLKEARSSDAQTGGSAYGPHRGDLHVDHLGKNMAGDLCSTGEQKMLLLALILAFTHLLAKDRDPLTLLLLDDVVAHLDEDHRRYLFQELDDRITQGIPLQIWMTGTHADDFSGINLLNIEGRVQVIDIEKHTKKNNTAL